MRISDWSSDVCSSDLCADRADPAGWGAAFAGHRQRHAGRGDRHWPATMVSGTVAVDRRPRAGNVGRAARCAIRRSVCPAREAPSIPGRGGMMGLAEYRRTQAQLADYLPWAGLVAPGVVLDTGHGQTPGGEKG